MSATVRTWVRRMAIGAGVCAAVGGLAPAVLAARAAPIIIKITSTQQFDAEVLKRSEERLMVAFFTTPWCSKCKRIDPSARDMATKADGRWGLAVVDADENEQLATRYNVAVLPTFLFMCQRQVHSRLVDDDRPARLQEEIAKEEAWCREAVRPIGDSGTSSTATESSPAQSSTPAPQQSSTPPPPPKEGPSIWWW